ncbi:MAG: sigma-70 family RNA polymerase sigma factor [Burkholderiaceae bacterium]
MQATAAFHSTPTFNPAMGLPVAWNEMFSHRSALVRFAKTRLHDPMLAEDVVHDVFEAVLSGRAAFAGRSALKSWLTAILKNKIVDLVRQRARTDSLALDNEDEGAYAIACPNPQPDEIAEQRQRLAQTLDRIDALPEALRDVVRLRILQDEPAEQVCRALSISEDNLFVRLHRARKQLLS